MEQSKTTFNPQQFLTRFYSTLKGDSENKINNKEEEWACEAFFVVTQCDSCLEIGCGPVLNLAACASRKCKHIYLADYNVESFQLIRSELQRKDQAAEQNEKPFWTQRFQLIAKIENINTKEVKQRLQQRITACFKCDLTQQNILCIPYLHKVDVITTSLTVQCVAENDKDYKRIIQNIKKYLKSRGFLYMFGSLEETFYIVKNQSLPVYPLTQQLIKQTLVDCQFQILLFNSEKHKNPPIHISDNKGFFSVLAQSLD